MIQRVIRPVLFTLACLSMINTTNAEEQLHIYNWSDYIAKDTIANFEKATGIKVVYDVYDSNELLEAKILAGRSGYDLIFPTARPFADRHLKAGLYQPINKSALSQYANLDTDILHLLVDVDPGNQYLIPYMWGTSGIGVNVDKVKAILGEDMPLDTWGLLFDPAIAAKLADCGVTLMDDPTEVFVAARAYAGKDTTDFSRSAVAEAANIVKAIRPNVRYFHSSQYINDLANGDICIAHGYSGDILQARDRAAEAGNGVNIAYIVPREGAVVWTDVMAILADAPNSQAAHKFIDYVLKPEVSAAITNHVAYANANAKATALVDEKIRADKGIYPPADTRAKLLTVKTPSNSEIRNMNRAWTRVKTGQ